MQDLLLYIMALVLIGFIILIAPKPSRKEGAKKKDKIAPEFIEIGGNVYEYVGKKKAPKTDYFGREVRR